MAAAPAAASGVAQAAQYSKVRPNEWRRLPLAPGVPMLAQTPRLTPRSSFAPAPPLSASGAEPTYSTGPSGYPQLVSTPAHTPKVRLT
jgi:hypothetical protein